jgi:hypothetical protein
MHKDDAGQEIWRGIGREAVRELETRSTIDGNLLRTAVWHQTRLSPFDAFVWQMPRGVNLAATT